MPKVPSSAHFPARGRAVLLCVRQHPGLRRGAGGAAVRANASGWEDRRRGHKDVSYLPSSMYMFYFSGKTSGI